MLSVVIMSRRVRPVFWPAVFAVLFLAAAQAVFWTYTFPTNVATRNWTTVPDAIGESGLSAAFNESNLGGASFRFKITIGR